MWNAAATRRNADKLKDDGVAVIAPGSGDLACGEMGEGRLADISRIIAVAERLIGETGPLMGKKALITTGPTREAIDPVRYISNNSSGEFGRIFARQLVHFGCEVTLIDANPPVHRSFDLDVEVLSAGSAAELRNLTIETAKRGYDWIFMFAAVADFAPEKASKAKLKKYLSSMSQVKLKPTADILSELSKLPGRHKLVGVSAETENVISNSLEKLAAKSLYAILAVDVGTASPPFGSAKMGGTLIFGDDDQVIVPAAPKEVVAFSMASELSRRS